MIVRIPVTRTYEVELDDARWTDPHSAHAAAQHARDLTPEQIERDGSLVDTETGCAQVVGPDYSHDIPCTD